LLHVHRTRFLWEGTCHERIALTNFGSRLCEIALELRVDADFADIFEVRGTPRQHRGRRLPPEPTAQGMVFRYEGLDGLTRETRVACDPPPRHDDGRLRFVLRAGPRAASSCVIAVSCGGSSPAALGRAWDEALAAATHAGTATRARVARVETSSDRFDRWMHRSVADVAMMLTDTAYGPYPYAGIPWFSTVFGRDAIVTALSMLWADPSIARGVLGYLAATQATEIDPEHDAQPGKILHEARDGEMAALGEVPFGRYYGSVDATPLFIVLAGRYLERTGDQRFARAIWPHVDAALRWIDQYGDVDGDGFVEYERASERGLRNQGWKDSHDAVFHHDGSPADGPIALCEVQGYVYAARKEAAAIASACRDSRRARELVRQADALRREFERRFWVESLGTYALALDGRKRPCEVLS